MPAFYSCTIREFLGTSTTEIVGELTTKIADSGFRQLESAAVDSWTDEIETLKTQLSKFCNSRLEAPNWGILLEFLIPRRQMRIDVVLLAGRLILVLEFKSSGNARVASSARQVEDYALDLSYFHAPSRDRVIVPILVGPGLNTEEAAEKTANVRALRTVAPDRLGALIGSIADSEPSSRQNQIDLTEWNHGAYEPVPTIIEAAMALYAGMSVREITHSRAGIQDITKTTDFVVSSVVQARERSEKVICFVTGIPGAGKTLVGMNIAHHKDIYGSDGRASVFMSGNGPLVKILREALVRDFVSRNGGSRKAASNRVSFVQNIHNFVRSYLDLPEINIPYEHAIVFDEAQRAWDAKQNRKKNPRKPATWHVSEPEMVLRIMDRHKDWAAIIALVGGGQEINEGEAGIAEWGNALKKYPGWKVLASPEALIGGESVAGASIFGNERPTNIIIEESALHLRVCNRSHQATELATWVNRVLSGDQAEARRLAGTFEQFPILLTRDLESARDWLRDAARGRRRSGLIASSGAARLRPYGLEISLGFRQTYPFQRWFLDEPEDIRSSFQLEVAASEFEIQGLELDFVGLCWGGDFIWGSEKQTWRSLQFTGKRWKDISNPERALRARNKYRVLMTRAREGLMIWVPKGDPTDATRDPLLMDETAQFLLSCGATEVL